MELMIPAPNWEFLKPAIQNGADAVYIPVQGLVTISYCGVLFFKEEVKSAIEYVHRYGRKAYVVFNAKLADNQYSDILQAIKDVIPYQPDGLVLGDYRLMSYVSDNYFNKNIEIIASVTCGIKSGRDVNFALSMGADRIIVPWLGWDAYERLKVYPNVGIDIMVDGKDGYKDFPMEKLADEKQVSGVKVVANCEIINYVNIIRGVRIRLDRAEGKDIPLAVNY